MCDVPHQFEALLPLPAKQGALRANAYLLACGAIQWAGLLLSAQLSCFPMRCSEAEVNAEGAC